MTNGNKCKYALRRSGFTLVEILVAIIILLVGVVAAISIFPRGFDIFRRTEEVTTAREQIEKLKMELFANPDNLPDAILPVEGSQPTPDFLWNDLSSISLLPDASLDYQQYQLPGNPDFWPLWEPMSARVLRHVMGEKCKIPSEFSATPGGVNVGFIPRYLPRFGPMEAGKPIIIYDLRYRNVKNTELTQLADIVDSLSDRLYYSIDYATGDVSLLPEPGGASRAIRITFYYIDNATGEIKQQSAEVITALPDTFNLLTIFTLPVGTKIVPGSERLNRAYAQDTTIISGDWNAIANLASGTFYIDGVFGGLMLGAIYFSKEDAGRMVKIDYTVADWNILHENVTVDADGYLQFALAPKMRRRAEGGREPKTLGLEGPMTNNGVVMALVDMNTGALSEIRVDNPGVVKPNYSLTLNGSNYILVPDSTLRTRWHIETSSDVNAGRSLKGKTYRAYYRALSDWTVQFFRPPAAFVYYKASSGATLDDLKNMPLVWDAFTTSIINGSCWVAVPSIFAGQSLAVDYQWQTSPSDPIIQVSGEAHTVPAADAGKKVSVFQLVHVPLDGTSPSVRGISVTARAIWLQTRSGQLTSINSSGVASTGNIRERWSAVELTTILPSGTE